ncbi:TauD/TfdA family dioxygenase [Asticcacaulis sp. AC402]|uniref:TauD/TfdA family dioxygenase n=1 Tax=Asticcacaulis sp. AC402 TaxID=1282361 RepID=UPI0003C3CCAA|nr:TauD/TfdA family dioxygenase [Asticcacaulis sp. AC402]ESQ73808.1 hypothetical protein ABAC402_17330 [Asticcacaulis sp. AC402]
MTGDLSFTADRLTVMTASGQVTLDATTLYDAAPCRFDPVSGQRLLPGGAGLEQPALTAADFGDDGLWLVFNGEERLLFSYEALEALAFDPPAATPVPWDRRHAETLMPVPYGAFLTDDGALRQALLQVAVHGFVRLAGAPARAGEIETAVARFGHIRETNYGRLFDVRTRPSADNLADTALALEVHSDNPYREPPPGLQILHAVQASAAGGQSLLVDGLAAAARLRRSDPAAYNLLTQVVVRFRWSNRDHDHRAEAPILTCDADGAPVTIRYNPRACLGPVGDAATQRAWRQANRAFAACVNAPDLTLRFNLAQGDMVIMDNSRVLHGRDAFPGETGERWLQGAYADRDGLMSRLRVLTRRHAERVVDDVAALFDSPACDQTYGEALSLRDHLLQTAQSVRQNGGSPSLIAAALLHDLGWLETQGAHEKSGAELLQPFFGAAVSEPVRLHVLAKRWLVTTSPEYLELLSPASIATLRQQGGTLTEDGCRDFEAEPWFDDAVFLRRAEDESKIPGAACLNFAAHRPLLLRLAARHSLLAEA